MSCLPPLVTTIRRLCSRPFRVFTPTGSAHAGCYRGIRPVHSHLHQGAISTRAASLPFSAAPLTRPSLLRRRRVTPRLAICGATLFLLSDQARLPSRGCVSDRTRLFGT